LRYLSGKHVPEPESALLLRTLLMHDYRRILLRDPELPSDMLPADWTGFEAHNVTAEIYRHIGELSARWFAENMENTSGRLPYADALFFKRYGGLPQHDKTS